MKLCYVDESGCGSEPVLILAGVVVDYSRMHKTKEDWRILLASLSEICGRQLREFHTREFYRGNGAWHATDGQLRARIISALLLWIKQRKHTLVFSGIVKERFLARITQDAELQSLATPWCAAMIHLMVSAQNCHQREKKNKGHTIFICDREVKEELRISELTYQPPEWIRNICATQKAKRILHQVIDVPFFAESEHVPLLQVADLIAYLLRSFVEIELGFSSPRYKEEAEHMRDWAATISSLSQDISFRWPARNRNAAQELFRHLTPEPLIALG